MLNDKYVHAFLDMAPQEATCVYRKHVYRLLFQDMFGFDTIRGVMKELKEKYLLER